MNISVGQRIALTLGSIFIIFLLTSVASYYSFNSVSQQLGVVVNQASPRVAISGDLRANLANTKYTLLEYLSGKGQQDAEQITQTLQNQNKAFSDSFQQLTDLDGLELKTIDIKAIDPKTIEDGQSSNSALERIQQVTGQIFSQSSDIVTQKSRYWSEQANIEAQAEEYKYLSSEIVYTLSDLLHEEFRYEYLKVLKPIRDDIAFLSSKITRTLDETSYEQAQTLFLDLQKTLKRIEKGIAGAKALDQEAYETILETWQPFKAQLLDEDLTLSSHLQSLQALQNSEQLLLQIEQLVSQNESLIHEFIQTAKDQQAAVKEATAETISTGTILIVSGAALSALC